MRLTKREIAAAKRATYFGGSPIGQWHDGKLDLSPDGKIAQLRGVEFIPDPADAKNPIVSNEEQWFISMKCLPDVAEWLGFGSVGRYIQTLEKEREAIFKRARY